MAVPFILPRFHAIDGNGKPRIGAKLYTYRNGSTTPLPTYRDRAEHAANTNPIILDAQGAAVIFLQAEQSYTFVLKDQHDSTVWHQDDVSGIINSKDHKNYQTPIVCGPIDFYAPPEDDSRPDDRRSRPMAANTELGANYITTTSKWLAPEGVTSIEITCIGGGGGGGSGGEGYVGGGGGGGGLTQTVKSVTPGKSYSVIVGAGGHGGTGTGTSGTSGGESSFDGYGARGGKGGESKADQVAQGGDAGRGNLGASLTAFSSSLGEGSNGVNGSHSAQIDFTFATGGTGGGPGGHGSGMPGPNNTNPLPYYGGGGGGGAGGLNGQNGGPGIVIVKWVKVTVYEA